MRCIGPTYKLSVQIGKIHILPSRTMESLKIMNLMRNHEKIYFLEIWLWNILIHTKIPFWEFRMWNNCILHKNQKPLELCSRGIFISHQNIIFGNCWRGTFVLHTKDPFFDNCTCGTFVFYTKFPNFWKSRDFKNFGDFSDFSGKNIEFSIVFRRYQISLLIMSKYFFKYCFDRKLAL